MKKHKLILGLISILLAFASCVKEGETPVPNGGDVTVNLWAGGQNLAMTRAINPFATEVPVTILVYKRTVTGTPVDVLTATPYRTYKTTTNTSGGMNDSADGKKLSVLSGNTYDFYAVVNPNGDFTAGVMNIINGTDLMVAKVLGQEITKENTAVTVDFGNLPHLGSQLQIRAYINTEVQDGFQPDVVTDFSVDRVTWSKLPRSASYTLEPAAAIQKLIVSPFYTGSQRLVPTNPNGTAPSFEVGGSVVVVPFPLAVANRNYNRINIEFLMSVNHGGVKFEATDVEVPEFKPNTAYKFIMEVQPADPTLNGQILLYLQITDWNNVEWNNGMGGPDGGANVIILLGSWDSVSWTSGMGGGNETMTIASVQGWNSRSWEANMGGTNTNNGTNN